MTALHTPRREGSNGLASNDSIGGQCLLFPQRDHRFAGVVTETAVV
ncbi:hypothetical protein ROV96_16005 [Stenotrophomonas pavanii]|nr:hypothetical protein [Stenotrophomonas pavanii]MDT3454731.1 hypothetical protein [Stenotrophomonas pavanii]MDT3465454.1 hypothetical protein [Stenotrophomonas pavanii]